MFGQSTQPIGLGDWLRSKTVNALKEQVTDYAKEQIKTRWEQFFGVTTPANTLDGANQQFDRDISPTGLWLRLLKEKSVPKGLYEYGKRNIENLSRMMGFAFSAK